MESRSLPISQISGRMYNTVVSIKCMTWKVCRSPTLIALLGNNYRLQIIETGFAEQFYASHRMGPAPICLKISTRIAERETYRMIPLKTRLFSHWSIPLTYALAISKSKKRLEKAPDGGKKEEENRHRQTNRKRKYSLMNTKLYWYNCLCVCNFGRNTG